MVWQLLELGTGRWLEKGGDGYKGTVVTNNYGSILKDWTLGCLGRLPRREKARHTQGEGTHAPGCRNHWGRGRHKTQTQPNPRFCGGPENWNRTQRRARSIYSSREPEQCRRGKHRHPCTGQTQCGRNTGSAPHTQQYLSAAPDLALAGLNWTSEPK